MIKCSHLSFNTPELGTIMKLPVKVKLIQVVLSMAKVLNYKNFIIEHTKQKVIMYVQVRFMQRLMKTQKKQVQLTKMQIIMVTMVIIITNIIIKNGKNGKLKMFYLKQQETTLSIYKSKYLQETHVMVRFTHKNTNLHIQ